MPAWVRGLYYRFVPYSSKDTFADDDAVYELPPLEQAPSLPPEDNNIDNTSHVTEYEIGSCSSLPELSYIRPQGFMSSDRISDCSSSSRVVSGTSLVSKSNNDSYIFDSVYGVIPVEVYEKGRLNERHNYNTNRTNSIHEYNSVNSNITTINNNNANNKQNEHMHLSTTHLPPPIRPLPPVRGQPKPNLTCDSGTSDRDKEDFGHGFEKGGCGAVGEEDKDR